MDVLKFHHHLLHIVKSVRIVIGIVSPELPAELFYSLSVFILRTYDPLATRTLLRIEYFQTDTQDTKHTNIPLCLIKYAEGSHLSKNSRDVATDPLVCACISKSRPVTP